MITKKKLVNIFNISMWIFIIVISGLMIIGMFQSLNQRVPEGVRVRSGILEIREGHIFIRMSPNKAKVILQYQNEIENFVRDQP